ncbi:septal ring lytic transglycosylase RlpA family protein [Emticicia sp. SJ17W-69]|uniref:septal ring lytic transglycosylase RlpA family protein n=1 Tax=Emticicia sp. SJ17W-69 TaxID=3421657 RepID=UPI003EBC9C37
MMIIRKVRFLLIFFLIKYVPLYSQQVPLGAEVFGAASYYSSKFYGKKTASGDILNRDEFTCAHPTLPFGTMLEVTNLANNKWCIVRVNDRGPYAHGRVIDVTHKAARHLGMFGSGIIKVKITVVGDHSTIYIGRPQFVFENSTDLVKDEDTEQPQIPLKQKKHVVKIKPNKNIKKKRAARKKKHK